jgi:hypothetical protein
MAASGGPAIDTPEGSWVESGQTKEFNILVNNLALQNELAAHNITVEKTLNGEKANTVYDNGLSKIIMKSADFSQLT